LKRAGIQQLIVIMGCPRSGTTWLHGMLAEHPRVAGLGETYLFTDYVAVLHGAYRRRWRPYVGLDKVLGEEAFRDCVRSFAREALESVAEQSGKSVLVEKSPANVLVWREIRALFPEAWLVHLLRDPRDVVASLTDAGRSWGRSWAPSGTVGAARLWQSFVEAGQGLEQDPRSLVVRYEELLEDGAGQLSRIFDAAGLEASPDRCREVVELHQFEQRAREEGAGPSRFLRRGRAGSWREDLSRRDVRIVEYVAGPLMDQLGYTRSLAPARRKPLGLAGYDLVRQAGRGVQRSSRLLFRRSLGLPDP